MKIFFSLSVLCSKLLALGCFRSMGMMAMAMEMEVEMPCHEGEMTQEFALEGCNTCEQAEATLSEDLVFLLNINEENLVTLEPNLYLETSFALANQRDLELVYRPPPQALLKTAFYHPKTTIVLIV